MIKSISQIQIKLAILLLVHGVFLKGYANDTIIYKGKVAYFACSSHAILSCIPSHMGTGTHGFFLLDSGNVDYKTGFFQFFKLYPTSNWMKIEVVKNDTSYKIDDVDILHKTNYLDSPNCKKLIISSEMSKRQRKKMWNFYGDWFFSVFKSQVDYENLCLAYKELNVEFIAIRTKKYAEVPLIEENLFSNYKFKSVQSPIYHVKNLIVKY